MNKDVRRARSSEPSSAESNPTYTDVKLEVMVENLETLVGSFRRLIAELTHEDRIEGMKMIRRALRETKFEFKKVLVHYGTHNEGTASRFVDLAYSIADMAAHSGSKELTESLSRHAEEIEAARLAALDAQ